MRRPRGAGRAWPLPWAAATELGRTGGRGAHLPRAAFPAAARRRRLQGLAALLLAAPLAVPGPASAQTIRGRLLDELTDAPVPGAAVHLLDREGRARRSAVTDSAGGFVLEADPPGAYHLRAEALGYEPVTSPLLDLGFEGVRALDLLIRPAPVGLAGFEVEVDAPADDLVKMYGLDPKLLDERWVSREEIEARPVTSSVAEVLRWQNIAGMTAPDDVCIILQRGRVGAGLDRCALRVLDGIPVTAETFALIAPEDIEAIAVLLPTEAATLFGTPGGGGAAMVFTRSGRARD